MIGQLDLSLGFWQGLALAFGREPFPDGPIDQARAERLWDLVRMAGYKLGVEAEAWRRFCRLLGQAEDLFSPDEDAAVEQGFRPVTEGRVLEGPYGRWLGHLMEGRCRLPELNPEAMKALLLAWLSSEVEGSWVCRGCG